MALDSISNFFGSNLTKKIKPKTWTLVSWVLFNYIKASCLSLLKKTKIIQNQILLIKPHKKFK